MALQEPFLHELPDELLDYIFTLAIESELRQVGYSTTRYKSALALSLTCRRFNLIVLPLLYHDPTVASLLAPKGVTTFDTISLVPPTLSVQRFYRTIQENPARSVYCKRLQISISCDNIPDAEIPAEPFRLAKNVLPCLTSLRSLTIHGGFKFAETWELIDLLLQSSPMIEDLALRSRGSMPVYMGHVYKHLNVPKGSTLCIESLKFQGKMRGDQATPPAIRPSTVREISYC
jgi:hypothetical protein